MPAGYGSQQEIDELANQARERAKSGDLSGAMSAMQQARTASEGVVDTRFGAGSDPRDMPGYSGRMTKAESELQMRRDVLPEEQKYKSAGLQVGAGRSTLQADRYAGQAQEAYGQQLGTRQYTSDQLARMEARARGEGTSLSELALADALAQSRAQASSMAAGARGGPGAQAAALRAAMYANAAAGQNAGAELAGAKVREQLGYEASLQQAAAAQRQADLAARGQGLGAEAGMAGLSADQYKAMLAAQMQYEKDRQQGALGLLGIGTTQRGQDIQRAMAEQQAEIEKRGQEFGMASSIVGSLMQAGGAGAAAKITKGGCFPGDCEVLTAEGPVALASIEGKVVRLATADGGFAESVVKNFGEHKVVVIKTETGLEIETTDAHAWPVVRDQAITQVNTPDVVGAMLVGANGKLHPVVSVEPTGKTAVVFCPTGLKGAAVVLGNGILTATYPE